MFFDAQAIVKKVSQENVVLEVTCLNATKTVTESLMHRNQMMGWGRLFRAGEQLSIDINIDDSDIEDIEDIGMNDLLAAEWHVCTIKSPIKQTMSELCAHA